MIYNFNGNGKSNSFDQLNLVRYFLLTCVSILLGYTISDFNPTFYKNFHTFQGQFILIFTFLVTGLVQFKDNPYWRRHVVIMACVAFGSAHILQYTKKQVNKKEDP